jgi:hypothetical protein
MENEKGNSSAGSTGPKRNITQGGGQPRINFDSLAQVTGTNLLKNTD